MWSWKKKKQLIRGHVFLHLILFCPFCKYSCKNICIYRFWNHSIDESLRSNFSPHGISLIFFLLIWFYMICNTCCFHESSLFMWIMLLLHESLGPWEINERFIVVFSGTGIITPFGLQIAHLLPLESPLRSISLFDSFVSEDRVPSSTSMRGEYFWPFDICLLCKGGDKGGERQCLIPSSWTRCMNRKSCFSLFLFFMLSCSTSWHLGVFDIAGAPGLILLKQE